MKIAILLATYNGEKFLREQIDSILHQTNKSWILYIRDDGSCDQTVAIINEYTSLYDNIILLSDSVLKRGACSNFLSMLENVDADYYLFCDQDDVWFSTKVDILVEILLLEESRYNQMPILINTDLVITDEALNIIAPSMWNNKVDHLEIAKKYLCVTNFVTGCTVIFNNEAKRCAFPVSRHATMHDHWLAMSIMASGGKIFSIPVATSYYRQHASNALGAFRKKGIFDISYNKKLYKMAREKTGISFISFAFRKIIFTLKKYI